MIYIVLTFLLTTCPLLGMKQTSLPNLPVTQGHADEQDDFLSAIERKDIFTLSRFLQKKPINLNTIIQSSSRSGSGSIKYSRQDMLPLMLAVEGGDPVIVTMLLGAGADVNKSSDQPPVSRAVDILLEKGLSKQRLSNEEVEAGMRIVDILIAHGAFVGQPSVISKKNIFHRIALYMNAHDVQEPIFANTWKIYFRLLMGMLQKEIAYQPTKIKKNKGKSKSPLDTLLDSLEPIFNMQDHSGKTVYNIACADGCTKDEHAPLCKCKFFERDYIANMFGLDTWREYGMRSQRQSLQRFQSDKH